MTPDVSKPLENPKLRELFSRLGSAEPSQKQELCEAIAEEIALRAYLLAAVLMEDGAIESHGDGKAVFKKDTMISFPFLFAGDGTAFLPVYTDWEALRKCEAYRDGQVKTLVLSFDDMAAVTAGQKGIVVNPYSDNFVIRPENVVQMKQCKEAAEKGFFTQTVREKTTVKIGTPASYPTAMAEAICRFAVRTKAIRAMWLKLMERDGEKSYLVIVDFDGDQNPVFKGIGDAASPHLEPGMFVDMVSYAERFGRQAATGEPFYRRKKGLFRNGG